MASRFAPSLFMHLLFTQRPPVATLMLEKKSFGALLGER